MPRRLRQLLVLALAVFALATLALTAPTLVMHRALMTEVADFGTGARRLRDPNGRPALSELLPSLSPDVSPLDAGTLMRRIAPPGVGRRQGDSADTGAFPILWNAAQLDSTLFADSRSAALATSPFARDSVFRSVRRGLTPEERAFAANVAGDSIWWAVDRAARAPFADLVAASFTPAVPADASILDLPVPQMRRINDLLDGTALRAASHLSAGRRDSAEAALVALYGLGLAFQRDGLNVIEHFIGFRLGSQALALLKGLHGAFPTADSPRVIAAIDSARQANQNVRRTRTPMTIDQTPTPPTSGRRHLLAVVTDTTIPRPIRFEALGLLSFSSCASPMALFFGEPADVRAARRDAERTLARTAADTAFLALLAAQVTTAKQPALATSGLARMYLRGNVLLGSVLFNPRLSRCAAVVAAFPTGR